MHCCLVNLLLGSGDTIVSALMFNLSLGMTVMQTDELTVCVMTKKNHRSLTTRNRKDLP